MNNKTEAKAPNDEANWQAIDIYMFSNGQQYSPPRKYHLQAKDLNWWDSTLNHLARSHYGSLHAGLELYSLDGQKIKGPLDLRDGMAYVAVVPPDAFIDSGYEKYLIKASRSWEKRQAKKTSIVDKPDDGRTDCGHFKPCCPCAKKGPQDNNATILGQKVASVLEYFLAQKDDDPEKDSPPEKDQQSAVYLYTNTELTTIKTPDENIAVESAMVRPQRSSTPKLDRSETQPPLKGIIASPKLSTPRQDRTRLTGQHTAFVKPGNSGNTQQRRVSVLKSKEGFQRQKLTKIPIKINEPSNVLGAKPKRLLKMLQTPPTPQPKPLSPAPPPPSTSASPSSTANAYQKLVTTLKDKSLVTDTAALDNLICDKEVIVITADDYKRRESEIRSCPLDSSRGAVIDELISCYMLNDGIEEGIQTHMERTKSDVDTRDIGIAYSDSKIKVIPATSTPKSNGFSWNIPLDDNYIAVINKGEAVNLNLTIDFQNTKSDLSVSDHARPRKISSLENIFKKKAGSLKDEETTVQTKSLQSLVSSVDDCFAKVVVVQCACCGNNTTVPRIDSMPVYKDDNGFFVLMPSPVTEVNQSCACNQNSDSISTDKKIVSELCLGEITKSKSRTDYPIIMRDAGVVMTVMNCGMPRINEWQKNVFDTYMVTKQVSINENQCTAASCCPSSTQALEKTEFVMSKCEQQKQLPYQTMDAYAQTEWCRVLLQVKCTNDGHYTFHLPSLETLKHYSI